MGVTNTTNYSLIKPNPGEERDAWGPYVNSNMDTIDTRLKSLADSKAEKGSTNTFTANQVISVNSSGDALRITQTGAGNALVVEDSANPDSTPFVVNANGEVGLGTSNPTVKLHLVGSDDVTSTLIAGTSKAIRIVPKLTHVQFEATDNTGVGSYEPLVIGGSTLQFAIGAAEAFRIAPTGAFGVSGANYGTSGQVLISGGSAAAPAWGTLGLSGGGTGATNAAGARANLGLGVLATLSTAPVANGGTGATTASAARTNLGLGTIATQASNAVAITGGSITGITNLAIADGGTGASDAAGARANLGLGALATLSTAPIANGGTGATDAAGARTNLGLGSLATQASNSVSITGGSVTGITDLAIADGGTGASTAAGARTNLGLGALATLNTVGTTEIADNSVTGAKIALGSDAQGDVMFYNGTDWARLGAGTAGQFLKTNGSAANPAWATVPSVGVDQTWQQPSRANSTSYQNTTGVPIQVAITGLTGGGVVNVEVSSDNSTWIVVGAFSSNAYASTNFIVPNSWYYRLNGSLSNRTWAELR